MRNNAIIRIVIYSIVIILLLGILAAGLGIGSLVFDFGIGAKNQITGEGCVPAAEVDTLKIEWSSGSITILTADTDTITFTENGTGNDNQKMVYSHSNGTLTIRYQKSTVNIGVTSLASKDLTITVPTDWECNKLDIDSASTDAEISGLILHEVDLDSASNSFDFLSCQIDELSVDGASNTIYLEGILNKLDCDGMSTDFTGVLTNTPNTIKMDGMSSSLELSLPADCGFRVTMDGLSNRFSSDFPAASKNGSYVYGDAACRIDVDGMSSEVRINENK